MSADDIQEIKNLINLYALAVDTQRWDLFDRVFTPDVEVKTGPNGEWSNLDALTHAWATFHDPLDGSTHTFTNHQVLVRGDEASALSYVTVRLLRQMEDAESYYEAAGWYDDTLVRTPAGWRIRKRTYGGSWWRGNPRVGGDDFAPLAGTLRRAAAAGEIAFLRVLTGE